MDPIAPLNFAEALRGVRDYWSPRVIGRLNDQYIKVARLKGEFVWHSHEHEDELFLVVYGRLRIRLENAEIVLGPGDSYVVPRGVSHFPVAEEECGVVLIEPVGTLHTGDVETPMSKSIEAQLAG